jgi:molybdate transport system permease protein
LKHRFAKSLPEKIILALIVLIAVTYVLFISVPFLAIFLRIDVSQISNQLSDAGIIEAIQLSLLTAGIATVISFVLAIPAAYFMVTRRFRGKAVIDTLMDLPIVLPPAVAGVALLYTFAPKGLLGPIFNAYGIMIPGTTVAVVIAEVFVASPFLYRSAKTGFEAMDKEVLNSARMLSGSRIRVFFTVTFPLSIRAIISGTMMTWARAMGEFGATLMFAGNIAGVTATMPLAIYNYLYYDPLGGITLSVILVIISFSVLIAVKILEQKRFGAKR